MLLWAFMNINWSYSTWKPLIPHTLQIIHVWHLMTQLFKFLKWYSRIQNMNCLCTKIPNFWLNVWKCLFSVMNNFQDSNSRCCIYSWNYNFTCISFSIGNYHLVSRCFLCCNGFLLTERLFSSRVTVYNHSALWGSASSSQGLWILFLCQNGSKLQQKLDHQPNIEKNVCKFQTLKAFINNLIYSNIFGDSNWSKTKRIVMFYLVYVNF